ncbi:MAG: hypothetical protein R6V83_07250 [Candidatus Thorarchaeota archaeon]
MILANTSFTVLIVTALFPLFFRLLVGNETLGDAMWGYAGSITMIVIALSSPVLGAIADFGGLKKKFTWNMTFHSRWNSQLRWRVLPSFSIFPSFLSYIYHYYTTRDHLTEQ